MSLLLTVYNTPAWKALADASGLPMITDAPSTALEGVALLQSVQSLSSVSALLLQLPAENNIWLAAVQAEYFLANAIENGNSLAEASMQWQEQTSALLTLHRQQRRQLRLFNLQQALAQPAAFRDNLSPAITISNYSPQTVNSNLALLAACQYLAQQPELHALNTRLQASVLPLCDSETLTLDIDQILQHNRKSTAQLANTNSKLDQLLQQLNTKQQQLDQITTKHNQQHETQQQLEATLKTTSEERDLILLHLQQVQEQLENYSQTSAAQLAAISNERDLLLQQINNMRQQLNQITAENNQLNLALHAEEQKSKHATLARDKQQAREIVKLESELRKTKARAASAEYAGQLLQQELNEIRGSSLWRVTGPMRVLGSLVKKTDKAHEQLLQDTALLLTSEYFDVEWYLRIYPDVAESKMNPAEHYLLYGATEGRLPGPLFDGNWYLQHYPDVATAGVNPLLHFIMFGQQEGRSSSPKLLTSNSQAIEEQS